MISAISEISAKSFGVMVKVGEYTMFKLKVKGQKSKVDWDNP